MKRVCDQCSKLKEMPDDRTICNTCHLKNELQRLRTERHQDPLRTGPHLPVGPQGPASLFPPASVQDAATTTELQTPSGSRIGTSIPGMTATGHTNMGMLTLLKAPAAKAILPILLSIILIAAAVGTARISKAQVTPTPTRAPSPYPGFPMDAGASPPMTITGVQSPTPGTTPGITPTPTSGTTPTPGDTSTPTPLPGVTPTPTPPPPLLNCVATTANSAMYGSGPCHTHTDPFEHRISAANVAELVQAWTPYHTDNGIVDSPVVANGIMYVGSLSGTIYALDAITGTLLWQHSLPGQIWSTAAVVQGIVYIGSTDGNVYALDAATGNPSWPQPFHTNGGVESSPTVVNGVVYIGSFDNNVYALDAATGKPIWPQPFATHGHIYSSPAVVGGIVYIGSFDGRVYAIESTTGQQKWVYSAGQSIYTSPAIVNGIVYVGGAVNATTGDVFALNALTGQRIWQRPTGGEVFSSPAVADGTVYISSYHSISSPSTVYAFNALTGTQRWAMTEGSYIWTTAPTVANGVVYMASRDAHVYALDAHSGSLLHMFSVFNTIYGSAVLANGMLYIGASSHYLYAFHLPS